MKITYTTHPQEIEVRASRSEYCHIAKLLRASERSSVTLDAHGDPSPYEAFATLLSIAILPTTKVHIQLDVGTYSVSISGDPHWLTVLAGNLESFGLEASDDTHLHVEYFDGHFYLAPTAAAVVFTLHHDSTSTITCG